MTSKLFVGNLDFQTTQAELEALFGEVGALREVFLPRDRATARPRGFAFVEYESPEDAARAIDRFNGKELSGRELRVNLAEARPPRPAGFSGSAPPPFERGGGGRPKGSRRNLRAKKRSL